MFTWLSNLKLTLTQWLLVVASAAIGVLVVSMRLQGGRLHKAQTDLLKERFGRTMDQQDAKVEAAKEKYLAAQKKYDKAKKLMLVLALLCLPSYAAECDDVLSACHDLTIQQDESIRMLKVHVEDLEKRLGDSQASKATPNWLIMAPLCISQGIVGYILDKPTGIALTGICAVSTILTYTLQF